MKRTILAGIFALLVVRCGAEPQQTSSSAAADNQACLPGIKSTVLRDEPVPPEIQPHIPKSAFVRVVFPLSASDTLTVYELGNWGRHWEKVDRHEEGSILTDPDTRLLVTRDHKPVFRYALKELPEYKDDDWGATFVLMKAVHQCSTDLDVTYLVLQSGNQGGLYLALRRDGERYRLVRVADAAQGRLVLHENNPRRVEVWSAVGGTCTACGKPFTIRILEYDGTNYRLISKRTTRKHYSGFQDEPLLMKPR